MNRRGSMNRRPLGRRWMFFVVFAVAKLVAIAYNERSLPQKGVTPVSDSQRQSWKPHPAVYITSAILAMTLFGDSLLYTVLPLYAPELGIPLGAVGVLLSANRWIRLLTNPLAARVFKRLGLLWPLTGAVTASFVSTFIYAQAWGFPLFLAARALWGLCWSHLRLANFMIILGTSAKGLGLALGAHHAITRLGSAFTVAFGGALIDNLGYRPGMTIMAGLTLLALPLLLILARLLPHHRVGIDKKPTGTSTEQQKHRAPEFSALFCRLGGFVASFTGAGILVSTLSLVLQQRLGTTFDIAGITVGIATISGLLFAVRWTSNLVVAPVVGRLTDLWGRRNVIYGFATGTMLLLTIFALWTSPLATIIAAILMFVSSQSLELAFEAAAGDNAATGDRAGAMSLFASFYDFGAASGPLLAYALGTAFNFHVPYYLGALLLAGLLILAGTRLAAPQHHRPTG